MAIIFDIKTRHVIPNWRDFKRTIQLGELNSVNKNLLAINIPIIRSINDWLSDPSIGTAADLISCAFVAGKLSYPEIKDAANFIDSHRTKSSKTLLDLIKLIDSDESSEINRPAEALLEINVKNNDFAGALKNEDLLHKMVHKTRNKAYKELKNPITWVELARMYSTVGQYRKAENAIITSLQLAPNNRFVLRSATRFFIHHHQFEKALFYLKKSNSVKFDPWLISAHIATSSLAQRHSIYVKDGENMISSNNFSPFDITELASSIGTLELEAGSFKKTKQYFNIALLSPNDNSLAQLEWLSKEDQRLSFNIFKYNVVNPFEAYALDFYQSGKWTLALSHTMKWLLDIPYSKRPVLLGSFIAGTFLKHFELAIELCELGLNANPNDPMLLNNLLYFSAISNHPGDYTRYINQLENINLNELPIETKIVLQATLGLIAFRKQNLEQGKMLYEIAISNSEKIKNDYLKSLAIINYTRELIDNHCDEASVYYEKLNNLKDNSSHPGLMALKQEVRLKYEKVNARH